MIGILLTNVGTPSACTTEAVRRYLAEFLSDPRVVELPRWFWWFILHGVVLRLRPRQSAKQYQSIWMKEGSPLLFLCKKLAEKMQEQLGDSYKVVLGMRYGRPSIQQALETLRKHPVQRITVLPLYPQYASATTGSTFDAVAQVFKAWRYIPKINFVSHYFDHPAYIAALAARIQTSPDTHLLFSFHGLPQRCIDRGDPYEYQCQTTVKLLAKKLQLSQKRYTVVFQSRFGFSTWLKPSCQETLKSLPAQGIKNVSVICPGFSVDCLETLEEIALRYRAIFLKAGGEFFRYIPALNATSAHSAALAQLCVTESCLANHYG